MFGCKRTLPVIAYHHVAPDREITPGIFEAHLRHFSEKGYKFLSGHDLLDFLGGKARPGKAVMITFDDGYADNWVYAFPLIRKYRAKALIFLPTSYIQNSENVRPTSEEGGGISDTIKNERGAEGFLTWGEARKMSESGFIEFGSHTVSHKDFKKENEYRTGIGYELSESKKVIEDALGKECYQMAWPWGYYKKEWLKSLENCGYKLAYLYSPGPNSEGSDPFLVYRSAARASGCFLRKFRLYENYYFMFLYKRIHGIDARIKRKLKSLFGRLF